ncbi:MAG: DinB family protein [Ilumatobacteraceae bacterium]|nr:DinB family protein [Ilumatobacteraceae bacterium]
MPIVPDDKNWTWVLERPCPDCGFVAEAFDPAEAPAAIRANAARWRELLAHPQATARPDDHTWSALEYACHVRDVYLLFGIRLQLMLDRDGPPFENWDQDSTAVAERYGEQDPARVAVELSEAATRLAAQFDDVDGAQWQRTGFRSDGSAFTVDSLARYLMHDPVHHLWDVGALR